MCCLTFIQTNREGVAGDVKVGSSLGCSDHETVKLSNGQRGSRAAGNCHLGVQDNKLESLHGSPRKNYMGTDSAGKRSLTELVDIPGSLPLCSRAIHPNGQEIR